jgi:hypothetical protein
LGSFQKNGKCGLVYSAVLWYSLDMSKRKKLAVVVLVLVLGIGIISTVSAISTENGKKHTIALQAAATSACTLDPQSFMATVNQWRASVSAPALAYSASLEAGANARLADMIAGSYYGHTNTTKEQSYTLVMKSDLAATMESEVLDGSNNAVQSMTNFHDSPEHYNALINPKYHYFAAVAVYHPHAWAQYNNDGSLQTDAGKTSANCLVVGELADKDGNVTVSSQVTSSSSTSKATTAPIVYAPTAYTLTAPTVQTPSVPVCDQAELAKVKANRDTLADEFSANHQAIMNTLAANYPSGYASSADYEIAVLQENQRSSQQNVDLQNSYKAALKQINC